MNSFFVFFKKEIVEVIRTKKFFILIGIFALFGMVGPVSARYMNEIVKMAMGDKTTFILSPTTWMDSWSQFYSNLSQMGGICIIFLFMSSVVGEKQSGSAALTLTKNLTHTSFILAKFLAAMITFLASFITASVLCYGYTYWFFNNAGKISDVCMGGLCYIVFTLMLLTFTILASTVTHNTTTSAIIAFASFIILGISNYIPVIGNYMPGVLLSKTVEISNGVMSSDIWIILLTSLCLGGVCLVLSIYFLKRQEI